MTPKNIHYYDIATKQIKIATHILVSDEANVLLPPLQLPPPTSVALQKTRWGYWLSCHPNNPNADSTSKLCIQLLSNHAKAPRRETVKAAGYDIYNATNKSVLQPSIPYNLCQPILPSNAQLTPMHCKHLVPVWFSTTKPSVRLMWLTQTTMATSRSSCITSQTRLSPLNLVTKLLNHQSSAMPHHPLLLLQPYPKLIKWKPASAIRNAVTGPTGSNP